METATVPATAMETATVPATAMETATAMEQEKLIQEDL
jgi:hypothetical protein